MGKYRRKQGTILICCCRTSPMPYSVLPPNQLLLSLSIIIDLVSFSLITLLISISLYKKPYPLIITSILVFSSYIIYSSITLCNVLKWVRVRKGVLYIFAWLLCRSYPQTNLVWSTSSPHPSFSTALSSPYGRSRNCRASLPRLTL